MVLHGQIIRQVFRLGTRYFKLEGQAFNKLYRGFPQSKTIGRGVRHGLTGGSIAGSLISPQGDENNNGLQKKQQSTPGKFYKTRRRFSTGRTRKLPSICYPRRRGLQRRTYRSRRM